jgi:probable HAF family extracellular repeat protein
MKRTGFSVITLLMSVLISASLRAQEPVSQKPYHHHFKIMDLGTFGGPTTYLNGGGRDLNNRGVVPATGETSIPDPFAPNCFLPECVVAYGFVWHGETRDNLGVLPEGESMLPQNPCLNCTWTSFPTWITDNGMISGFSENNSLDALAGVPATLGVLWFDDKIVNLGTLGGAQSGAVAVNQQGDVVGTALNTILDPFPNRFPYVPNVYLANATETHAFLWRSGVMHDLGTLGGPDSVAGYINDSDQITGQSDLDFNFNPLTGNPTVHPFFWEKGHMQDLGGLGGTFGFPYWMNSRGDVVGWSNLAGDTTAHPFLWTKEGGMQDLGTLGGSFGHADSINDRREVVGTAYPVGDQGLRAFLWKGGIMTNLGTLGDDPDSEAGNINSRGQIVGGTYILGVEDLRGFLWENGGPMVDLNTLVVNGSGIRILGPTNINERGEIAAPGVLPNGGIRALLLIPCDEDHPNVEGCDYSLAATPTQTPVMAQRKLTLGETKDRVRAAMTNQKRRFGAHK